MKLITRNTQRDDLPACFRLVEPDYLDLGQRAQEGRRPDRADLLRLWKHLLQHGLARSAVVEVEEVASSSFQPGLTARIVGFGLSVFVTDWFLREYRAHPRPFLVTAVLDAWQNKCAPFLDARALSQANQKDGVNVLGLHTCWSGLSGKFGGDSPQLVAVRDAMMGALFQFHQDVRLKTFCKEIYGDQELTRYRQFGMEPWPDETFYAGETGGAVCYRSSSSRPYLMGIDCATALAKEGSVIRALFQQGRPARLNLTEPQRAIVRLALAGKTDREIAEALAPASGEDTESLQKRWNRLRKIWRPLFERISLLEADVADVTMGNEVRRKVLHFVSEHPEEVAPAGSARP